MPGKTSENDEALRLREQGYRDGFHGHDRRSQDGRYLASYKRGQERRAQLASGEIDDE